MALMYQVKSRTFSQDRQKWQVAMSAYAQNPVDPAIPVLIPEFDNVAIDVSDPSEQTIKIACVAFLQHVESARSTGVSNLINKIVDSESGQIVQIP